MPNELPKERDCKGNNNKFLKHFDLLHFSFNQQIWKSISGNNQYESRVHLQNLKEDPICKESKNRRTQPTHAMPKPVNRQGRIMRVSRFSIQESESSVLDRLTKSTTKNEYYYIQQHQNFLLHYHATQTDARSKRKKCNTSGTGDEDSKRGFRHCYEN